MKRAAAFLILIAATTPAGGADSESREAPKKTGSAVLRAREAVRTGVAWLIENQNDDGSWGHHAQKSPFEIWAPVPGGHRAFRGAASALAYMALLRAPGGAEELVAARRKGLDYLVENGRAKRSQGAEIYAVWSWAYSLKALARTLEAGGLDEEREARVRAAASSIVRGVRSHQFLNGGWGYFDFNAKTRRPSGDSMSFTTATVLLALHEAREAGIAVDDAMIGRAVANLRKCRTPEGAYVYSFFWRYRPTGVINRPQGSLTRTPGCDLALYRLGGKHPEHEIDRDDLLKGVATLLEKRKFARMALHRPVPHESWFAVSGYFYLYGYSYAADICRALPAEVVEPMRDALIEEVLATRHPDGSFWDYPLYGYSKPYGTGYALNALLTLVTAHE